MAAKTGKKDKKKGPKGKKARAKAKLERQWGEEAHDEGQQRNRGRQQQQSIPRKEHEPPIQRETPTQPVAHTDGSFQSFLQSIRQDKSTESHQQCNTTDDEDDDDSSQQNVVADEPHHEKQQYLLQQDNIRSDFDAFNDRYVARTTNTMEQTTQSNLNYTKIYPTFVETTLELQVSEGWTHKCKVRQGNEEEWKLRCQKDWANQRSIQSNEHTVSSPWQTLVYPLLANYLDVLHTGETPTSRPAVQQTILWHIINHVVRSRRNIRQHNQQIQQQREQEHPEPNEAWRDQGFTRPTVLVLLPTRGCCYQFVQELLALSHSTDPSDRFPTEFGPPVVEQDTDQAEQTSRRKKVLQQKGREWLELFGDEVNSDDDFKLGIALNLKTTKSSSYAVSLYTDFYKSDIIVASPLGLKVLVESKDDSDFLSSIEIAVVARADVLLMQNWDHVNEVLDMLNQQPKNSNETDFSRVREYLLTGQAAHWRQLIICSQFPDPMILSSFKRYAKSADGLARLRRRVPAEDASITSVFLPVRQVFQRIPVTSLDRQNVERLQYFEEKVLSPIVRNKQSHTMIFIPSYFDFVAVRNLFLKKELDFVSVTEYARTSEVSRGRARFLQGRKPILLYTGRAHYFLRHAIKGVRHLIFYSLPEHPEFYADQVNLLNEGLEDEADDMLNCVALYTRYDSHALERIVGTSNCSRMIKGEKSTFLFTV